MARCGCQCAMTETLVKQYTVPESSLNDRTLTAHPTAADNTYRAYEMVHWQEHEVTGLLGACVVLHNNLLMTTAANTMHESAIFPSKLNKISVLRLNLSDLLAKFYH
jgi:hypothetical protein